MSLLPCPGCGIHVDGPCPNGCARTSGPSVAALLLGLAVIGAGCTVEPPYGSPTDTIPSDTSDTADTSDTGT